MYCHSDQCILLVPEGSGLATRAIRVSSNGEIRTLGSTTPQLYWALGGSIEANQTCSLKQAHVWLDGTDVLSSCISKPTTLRQKISEGKLNVRCVGKSSMYVKRMRDDSTMELHSGMKTSLLLYDTLMLTPRCLLRVCVVDKSVASEMCRGFLGTTVLDQILSDVTAELVKQHSRNSCYREEELCISQNATPELGGEEEGNHRLRESTRKRSRASGKAIVAPPIQYFSSSSSGLRPAAAAAASMEEEDDDLSIGHELKEVGIPSPYASSLLPPVMPGPSVLENFQRSQAEWDESIDKWEAIAEQDGTTPRARRLLAKKSGEGVNRPLSMGDMQGNLKNARMPSNDESQMVYYDHD